ncbi:K02A2.6-like [Cordylochernes scorpioides]|uniref:RNA-directed DNA polymerase n=1 Tax=Cordylochernes scorpioides TaxID=51811 RepID=A0ABY6JX70_9ARAC|nr:K02A2.6-like [Cordylochernes scorpioides]
MPGHRKRRQFKQTDAFTRGMVIGLKRAGWSIRQIAADTHLGASTVHRLWRRWLEQGNVAIYRNVGATRVTSARVDRRILRQAVAAPQATCTAILQHVQDTLDHSISTRTISRRLVANGLHSCRPLRRLPLTPSNRRQRLEWCRARSTWMTEWHRVVFSDESRFCLSSDSRRVRVWRRRGERSNPAAIVERPTVRQRGIMVWGAIEYDSRSPLLRIQGTMTAQRYVDDVLRPVTLPYLQGVPNALYQQDNARPHTARISQQALQDVQMLPWPPYSPDLSPIEHVWDIIGRRLHALPQPRSEDELWQMVEREWRAIPQDAIRTLIDSLPRRVAACIAVRGVGLLKNKQSILIKEDAIPQAYTARRLPLALREPVREELEKMSKLGVIKKINKPTEWSHPMVVVKKPNGDVRICIDPRKLNYWIKRERYVMPSPEEVLALIQKANIYTVLDAKYAFWQIPLTDEASLLTTILPEKNGLKFDKTKTQLMQPSVRYLGHIVSTEGIRPLESKTANMRLLLRKNEPWVWNDLRERDYRDLKLQLTSAPCLRHFDPKLDIEISTDASSNGLGAVLQQQGVPITYSSTALSAAQNKYSQIEKELLAVYFGCKRNHLYLYGRKFTAFTDHKPLLTIMKKPMVDLSPRLQRLVLQLQHYDFDLRYIPGKKLYTADALSRDYIANDLFITPEIEISQNNQVLMVTYSNNHHQDLVEATNNDPVLQEVKNYIENGWPIHKKTMNPLVKPFWDIKEELFEWEGLLCRGVKLVIPEKRRNHILSLLHKAHRGINSTLSLARSTFYWPGMCQEVEEFVKKFEYVKNILGITLKNLLYLMKPAIIHFKKSESTKAEMVIEKLKEVFARFGVPEIMMTDNGPPFQSTEMMEFAKEWNVTHTTSSPRFPQSNGMIERTIQTLKSTIIKCQQSKQDIYQALLLLRNTEHKSLPSPAIMLYGRKQKLFLPMKTTLMNESRICEDSIRKQHEANQSKMKFYFNRHARDLPSLENGQSVLVRQEKQWSPAKVIAPGVHPRSYLLEDTKGSVLRRNRRDLRPAGTLSGPTEKESPPEKQEQLDPQPSTSSQSEETSATTRTRCGRLVKPPVRLNL